MKTKATKKFLSIALAVVMIMGSAVMMFAYAGDVQQETPATQTTPLAYATAENGALLYTADFTSEYFTVDQALLDSREYVNIAASGEPANYVWQSAHSVKDEDPETPGVQVPSAFATEGSIILNGTNTENTVANEVAIGGYFEDYPLENATYTVTAKVKRTDLLRVAFWYFQGYSTAGKVGALNKFWGTENADNKTNEASGAPVGIVNVANATSGAAGYGNYFSHYVGLSNQNLADGYGLFANQYINKVDTKSYAEDIEYKYVIIGGAKNADNQIPVNIAIYGKKDDGTYALIAKDVGLSVNPYLWIGMGRWDVFKNDPDGNPAYMELSDVNIYKGDTTGITGGAFGQSFKTLYDAAEDGDVLFTVNGEGLADSTKAYDNGYSWYNHGGTTKQVINSEKTRLTDKTTAISAVPATTYDAEKGMFSINPIVVTPDNPETTDVNEIEYLNGVKKGFSTTLPLGTDWNNGIYTMEMCVTSNTRTGIHFTNSQSRRLGFVVDGNNGDTFCGNYKVSAGFGQDGNFRDANNASHVPNLTFMGTCFDVNQNVVRKDTSATGDVNVRIVFNFDEKTVSLYELGAASDKWQKVAGVNFSAKAGQQLGADLTFSVHAYDALADIDISNVRIIKGNPIGEFYFGFANTYEDANWGVKLLNLNTSGMTNDLLNGEGGYNWSKRATAPTVDKDGFIYLNNTSSGSQGAYTPIPFADEWDTGYYTMSFCLNNAARVKMGLFDIVRDSDGLTTDYRVGFAFIPNLRYIPEEPAVGTEGEEGYKPAVPAHTVSDESKETDTDEIKANKVYIQQSKYDLYFGSCDNYYVREGSSDKYKLNEGYSFDGIDDSTKVSNGVATSTNYGIKTIIYDTFVADSDDEDATIDDPRIVRMQGGNNPNVRIEFNCIDKIITLFERADGKWHKISAIDYSELADGYTLKPVFDLYAYDANSNITLKDVEYTKGLQTTHLYSYVAGGIDTGILTHDYNGEDVTEILEEYINKYALTGADLKGWTVDGGRTAVEDFETVYNNFSEHVYAPKVVNIVPLINYAELAEAVALRGVRFSKVDEDGKYNVEFVAALGDIDLKAYKQVGFDIVKRTEVEGVVTDTPLAAVETDKVHNKLNSNGAAINASAFGGKYVVAAGLEGEVAGGQVDYIVTAYVVAQDGTKTSAAESMTFTFVDGEYTPTVAALEIADPAVD